MSLINQMLKDLEQRRAGRLRATHLFLSPTATLGKSNPMLWIAAAGVILLAVISLLLMSIYLKPAAAKKMPVPFIIPPAKKIPVTVMPAPIPLSTLVRAFAINGDKKNTRLAIYLNKPSHYTIGSDPAQNTLTLIIDNCQLAEPLLPLNVRNTLIKSLAVNPVGNQLKVAMAVQEGAQIAQLKLENNANTVLILDLTTDVNSLQAMAVNNVATINPANLTNTVLDKTGLNKAPVADDQAYIEKVPQPLTSDQLAERDYQTAINLIQANHWQDATVLLQQILLRTPDASAARTALITLLIKQNQLAEAETIVQAGLALQPHNPAFTKLAAQILLLQNNPERALAILKTAAPVLTTDPDYYALMAALYQKLGYVLKSAQIYEQLVAFNGNNAIWWLGLATSLETAGKNKAALEAYQNANIAGNLSPQLQSYVNARMHALGGT